MSAYDDDIERLRKLVRTQLMRAYDSPERRDAAAALDQLADKLQAERRGF